VAEEVSGFRARRRAYRVHGPRFAAPGSADRSRPPERSAQAAGRRVREPGRPLAPRRVDTTADAGETATPPARAPERDGDRRMSSFSSRSRTRRRSARSPASRCPLVLATAASAATATPPPEAAQAHAGPRPRSELPRGCARRATANAGRRARARVQGREWRRPPRAPPRSRRQAPAARWRRSPSTRQRLSTAAGIAGGARSSSQTVTHAMFLQPAQSSRRCSHRLGTLQRYPPALAFPTRLINAASEPRRSHQRKTGSSPRPQRVLRAGAWQVPPAAASLIHLLPVRAKRGICGHERTHREMATPTQVLRDQANLQALTESPLTDSNRRPLPYHGSALPAELRGRRRERIASPPGLVACQ
jgi:hypothetical protein